MVKDIGKISISSDEVHWIIPNFYDLSQEIMIIRSPRFNFQKRAWYLQVYANESGWFGISATIFRYTSNCRIIRLGIMGATERNFVKFRAESNRGGMYGKRLFPSSFLESWKDLLVPRGDLHVVFDTKNEGDFSSEHSFLIQLAYGNVDEWLRENYENRCLEASTQTEEKINKSEKIGVEAFTQTEEKIINQASKENHADSCIKQSAQAEKGNEGHSSCFKVQSLHRNQIWSENLQLRHPFSSSVVRKNRQLFIEQNKSENIGVEAFTQTEEKIINHVPKENHVDFCMKQRAQAEKRNGYEKLSQDFEEILLTGSVSDAVIKVKDEEFKVHRSILAARSPVLLAMLTHETKKKNTGKVQIPDVDPKIFSIFLNYLYTGSVANLTSKNAVQLYTIAEKYQVKELKDCCFEFMLSNISNDNFCDVFTLSLGHNGKRLKETCIQFFANNSLDIILTSKWQAFLCENPIIGNELFIKHFQLNKYE